MNRIGLEKRVFFSYFASDHLTNLWNLFETCTNALRNSYLVEIGEAFRRL